MKARMLVPALVAASILGVSSPPAPAAADGKCWGQATRVFARMGEMGRHASSYETPRLGLRNLARALYDAGVLPDDTMASLGAFVADQLGLTIEACR
jgi:hypothetical protein